MRGIIRRCFLDSAFCSMYGWLELKFVRLTFYWFLVAPVYLIFLRKMFGIVNLIRGTILFTQPALQR